MSLKGIFPIDKWDFNSRSILDKLPTEDSERLLQNATEKIYIKGATVFREGMHARGIFYIKEGKIKKYRADNFGKEQIIYVANPGELIGYHAVLATEPYPDSASMLETGILTFIPRKDFLAVLDQSPVLSKRLLKTLSHEFSVLTNNISVFTQRPVRERLAITLLILREKYKSNNSPNDSIEINLSRDDIANMTGATRENIVRLLRDFKDEKLIEAKGRRIRILDVKRLAAISNYL